MPIPAESLERAKAQQLPLLRGFTFGQR